MPRTMSKYLPMLLVATTCVWVTGCLVPDPIDQNLVNRYQEAMVKHGPLQRGSEGVQIIKPVPGTTGPAMKVQTVTDANGRVVAKRIPLTLEDAVMRVAANNPGIRAVSYDPAMSREAMMEAAAYFDIVAFGGINYNKSDKAQSNSVTSTETRTSLYEAGLKQQTITGAQWQLAWMMTRNNDGPTTINTPNPRYENTLVFTGTQPLLRNGWDYNLAKLEVAALTNKNDEAAFRQAVEEIISNTVQAYWQLWQSTRDVEIAERYLKEAQDILDVVRQQRERGTASDLQVEQVETTVRSRQATVVQAKSLLLDARDRLARLLADADINILNDLEIDPTSVPVTDPVKIDPIDQMFMAMKYNPQLEQARIAIQMADVDIRVADNQALPKLDLNATTGMQGLDATAKTANNMMWDGHYVSYGLGLQYEQPIGNRAAEAEKRRTRLARLKSISKMQDTADQVGLAIRQGVRQVGTQYELLQVQREAARVARAYTDRWKVRISREVGESMKPERLSIVLQAQESDAQAERAVLTATVNYNTSMVELAKVTGTIMEMYRVRIAQISGDAYWNNSKPDAAKPAPGSAPSGAPPGKK